MRHWLASFLDRMREQITPYVFVNEFAIRIFNRRSAGDDRPVRALWVVLHVGVGDETARIAIGRRGFVHVHDRAELLKAQQFPRAAIVISLPAVIEHVTKTEETVRR